MPRTARITLVLGCLALLPRCGHDTIKPAIPEGWEESTSGSPIRNDLGPGPDGLPNDKGGPTIELLAPDEKTTIVDDLLRVQAKITDDDGVDPQSVTLTVQDLATAKMTITSEPDVFEAIVDISKVSSGAVRFWVKAADLLGNQSSAVRELKRSKGPEIQFLSPSELGRYKGRLKVQVLITDDAGLRSVDLALGGKSIKKGNTSNVSFLLVANIEFDDPYDPPLVGEQLLTVRAVNKDGAETVAERTFVVDVEGPEITIMTPMVGEVVGGLMAIEATISDLAGVLPSSARCVIGNDQQTREVDLKSAGGDLYTGAFDTRTLDDTDLWPVLSCRATDVLGNESHEDFQIGVDNAAPIIELDPPDSFFMGRFVNGELECSYPFDPVGGDAANDGELVPRVIPLRARIEDQGNSVPAASFVPIALVDPAKVSLYVLDDTSKPLVVDSTGDGFCDAINPEVIPLGSVVQPGEAVADMMAPVEPTGKADYREYEGNFPFNACSAGDESSPPDPLCAITDLTVAISYAASATEPALWTIPPPVPESEAQCLGLPFDFAANEIENGWVCVAIEATDHVGNRGVSPPLRLWLNKAAPQRGPAPGSAGTPPSCVGSVQNGKVTTKSCKLRSYPTNTLRIEK